MDKAIVIIPDNNKGKFISKGYSAAVKELAYFVIEKKLFDINSEEIKKISPAIIFIFWTGLSQRDIIEDTVSNYDNEDTVFIHTAELSSSIPDIYKDKDNHYIFTTDFKTKKNEFKFGIIPNDYKTKFQGYKFNITFAGNPATKNREEILSQLIYNFGPVNIFCRSFDFYKSLDEITEKGLLKDYFLELYKQSYKGYVESQKELSDIYCASKINIDMENENPKSVNYRCLEIMASGGFLISQYNPKLVKYFDEGKEIETFKNAEDLTDKINFYLKNLNLAQLIAAKGKQNTLNNFSYYDNLKTMLKVIYGEDTGN